MSEFNPKEYWEKRLKESYGLHGVGFIGHGTAYNTKMYQIRRYIFKKYVSKFCKINSDYRVLDIGSGTGFYIDCWRKIGVKHITGSDITAVAIENLINNFPGNDFYQLDISDENLPIALKSMDAVSAFDVLFHIVDDDKFEKAISNIYKLLKPGGVFILSDNFIHDKTERSLHHVSRNINYFYDVLEKNNFEILIRKPSFYFMNTPVDGRRKILRWFWNFQAKLIYRGPGWAKFISVLVYPLERLALLLAKEGPSTEIMICRKKV